MINFFRRLFNHDKIEELERSLEIYRERCEQLEDDNKEYKGYKLKYRVAMLQNNEAEYLELLEMAEKVDKHKVGEMDRQEMLIRGATGQHAFMQGLGGLGGQQGAAFGQQNPLLAQHMAASSGRWL